MEFVLISALVLFGLLNLFEIPDEMYRGHRPPEHPPGYKNIKPKLKGKRK